MYLMELIIDVLKINKRNILAYIINTSLLITFYWLLLDSREVLYPAIISLFIFVIYFLIELLKHRDFVKNLDDAKKSSDYKCNTLEKHDNMVFSTIQDIHNEYTKKFYSMHCTQKDRDALFSEWVHNMKTSITVIDLASEKGFLDNCDKSFLQDIKEENNKLKLNLEQCLNVLRLDDFSRDYLPEKVNLLAMVNEIVNSKKREFIYKGVYPKVSIGKLVEVYTDKKWCSYMIDQLLSNAIKYTNSHENKIVCVTSVTQDEDIVLSIKDEGCGIDIEDMPRIFDAFFTGNNGRQDRNATGIGLYMVKLIGDKLNHKIYVNSKKEEGTEFKIRFLSKM